MVREIGSCRVLVTPTTFGRDDHQLREHLESKVGEVIYNTTGRPLTSAELMELIPGVDGYVAGVDVVDRLVIQSADRLKVIARYGVGVDSIDLEAAREKGIVVTNTPGANATSVAELAIGMIVSLARQIPAAVQATRAGGWPRLHGLTLEGKTVGLIGFGSIGQAVARRLSSFGCRILAFDPLMDHEKASTLGVEVGSLDDVVRQSDFLSLHCPLNQDTRGMVNLDLLERMKPGSLLVNTARGELIDEDALLAALQSGKLRGAALDVFSQQPPDPASPLLMLPQVLLTPHMGAHTDGAARAMGWDALRDCLAVLHGEQPAHRVV